LRDISQSLQRNIDRSWGLIIVPNAICIGGAFFAGFGVMHSMVFNQIGAVVALANGLLPLRKVAEAQAEKERAAEHLIRFGEQATEKREGKKPLEELEEEVIKEIKKEAVKEIRKETIRALEEEAEEEVEETALGALVIV
jgi:hypothetical protein